MREDAYLMFAHEQTRDGVPSEGASRPSDQNPRHDAAALPSDISGFPAELPASRVPERAMLEHAVVPLVQAAPSPPEAHDSRPYFDRGVVVYVPDYQLYRDETVTFIAQVSLRRAGLLGNANSIALRRHWRKRETFVTARLAGRAYVYE